MSQFILTRIAELKKGIYTGTRLKNRLNKHPSKENEIAFKKQRNRCVTLRKKAIKNHFKKVTSDGLMSYKAFWDLVKPFLSNKGGMTGNEISLVNGDRIVTDDLELCEVFNYYYINIVENISGKKPCKIDLLAILRKSLDRAIFLYNFIHDVRSSGARASIAILHIRKFYKL